MNSPSKNSHRDKFTNLPLIRHKKKHAIWLIHCSLGKKWSFPWLPCLPIHLSDSSAVSFLLNKIISIGVPYKHIQTCFFIFYNNILSFKFHCTFCCHILQRPAVLLQGLMWKDFVHSRGKSEPVDENGQQSEGRVYPHPKDKPWSSDDGTLTLLLNKYTHAHTDFLKFTLFLC